MAVLKETSAVREYWLEPDSRNVEPQSLFMTDSSGKILEEIPYSPNAGLEIKASSDRRLCVLVDFGRQVGGYPVLRFGTGNCRMAGVQAVESLKHLARPLAAEPASIADPGLQVAHFRPWRTGLVELPHFGGFRYLWLFPLMPGRATLKEVSVDYTPHIPPDPDSCGYFLSSDDTLNRAWFAGLHTVEMCTVDPALGGRKGNHRIGQGDWVLIDGAKRDRLIWTGDISPMGAAIYVSDFNTAAVRDSLTSLSSQQRGDGYIPGCSPATVLGRVASGFFGDYVAWWIITLYQYYLHTGDSETLEAEMPVVKKALGYLHKQCRGGLYRQNPLNMFEWCFTVLRRGKPSYTNILYYWALNCASFLAYEIGDEETSGGCVSRAFRLGEVIVRELWDMERGVFVDSTSDRRRSPQDANSLAIVSGLIGEPETANGMLDYMRERLWEEWGSANVDFPYYRLTPGLPAHNRRVVPFMNNYEALARFMAGDDGGAMELIRRCWGNMVDREPATTFWEWTGRHGEVDNHFTSLCHGWSAGVVPLLSKFVLGIRPAAVAYRRYRFDPRPCGLEWVEGRVPVPGGFIEARVERKRDSYVQKVSAPGGITAVG